MAALGERDVDAVEVVNEPNFQLWPQADVHVAVARMMATARAVLRGDRLLVGPATADRRGSGPLDTDHLEFARALLDELDRDRIRAERADGLVAPQLRRRRVRQRTIGSRPSASSCASAGRASPILVTESGARLTTIAREDRLRDDARVRRRQAELITRGYERLRPGPEGDGVDAGPPVPVHHRHELRLRPVRARRPAAAVLLRVGASCQTAA